MENNMRAFLSPERQKKLRELLGECGGTLSQKAIDRFVTFPDDPKEVDMQLYCHGQCVARFDEENDAEQVGIGLACMTMIMLEAQERGYSETDFPVSHEFIKQDVLRMRQQQPPTLQ